MPPPTLAPSRSAAIRVAVVEDDAACRQSLVQALQAAPDMQLAWQGAARAGGLGPAAAGRHRVHAVAAAACARRAARRQRVSDHAAGARSGRVSAGCLIAASPRTDGADQPRSCSLSLWERVGVSASGTSERIGA